MAGIAAIALTGPAVAQVHSVESVVVTASPIHNSADDLVSIPASVDAKQILRSGGATLADALANIPGVSGSGFSSGSSRTGASCWHRNTRPDPPNTARISSTLWALPVAMNTVVMDPIEARDRPPVAPETPKPTHPDQRPWTNARLEPLSRRNNPLAWATLMTSSSE